MVNCHSSLLGFYSCHPCHDARRALVQKGGTAPSAAVASLMRMRLLSRPGEYSTTTAAAAATRGFDSPRVPVPPRPPLAADGVAGAAGRAGAVEAAPMMRCAAFVILRRVFVRNTMDAGPDSSARALTWCTDSRTQQ